MASNTSNLGLLMKDPVTDGNDTFNVETMLNENWRKIDNAVGALNQIRVGSAVPASSLGADGDLYIRVRGI